MAVRGPALRASVGASNAGGGCDCLLAVGEARDPPPCWLPPARRAGKPAHAFRATDGAEQIGAGTGSRPEGAEGRGGRGGDIGC